MIIGFSSYGQGGSGPALDYLTGYLVNGEARDPKPEIVRGDPNVVAEIIDTLPFKYRYSSGVCSFAAEDRVTPEIQEDIINRFEDAVFSGLAPDRRSIVWIKHQDKGRTELHFVVPRVDLGTGKALNIAPPTPASRQLFDTLRESINLRYGFRDPSDPACKQPVSVPAHVAKLTAQARRVGRSAKSDIRQVITERLLASARAGRISNRADVTRSLREQGFTLSREGINYVTVVCPGTGERVRLKGEIFRRHFRPDDLQPPIRRHDPARLLVLDRCLERLVEKRASFHRAKYEVTAPLIAPVQEKKELIDDRTRNPAAASSPTHGAGASSPRPTVCPNALRLDEASQHLGRASDRLEFARDGLVQAHDSVTRDFDSAVAEANRTQHVDELVSRYEVAAQLQIQNRDLELELER